MLLVYLPLPLFGFLLQLYGSSEIYARHLKQTLENRTMHSVHYLIQS